MTTDARDGVSPQPSTLQRQSRQRDRSGSGKPQAGLLAGSNGAFIATTLRHSMFKQFAVAFAAVVGTVIVGLIIGAWSLAQFTTSDDHATNAYTYMLALRDVETRFRQDNGVLENLLLTDDGEQKKKLEQSADDLNIAIRRLEELRPSEQDFAEKLTADIGGWRTAAKVDMKIMLSTDETRALRDRVFAALAAKRAVEEERVLVLAQAKNRAHLSVIVTSIASVAAALLAAILACAWLLASIQRPIVQLTSSVQSLARGNLSVEVPETNRKTEIGMIAHAIRGFRDGLVERLRLRESTEAEAVARRKRQESLEQEIRRFEDTVRRLLDEVNRK